MGRIFDLILEYKEYAALTLLALFSLFLIGNSDAPEIRSLRAFFVGVAGAVQSGTAWIPNPVEERSENKALHDLNLELAAEVGRLRQAGVENERLRAMLGFKQRTAFRVLAADVIGKTIAEARNTITLNAGAKDSVALDMPIITDAGVVGRVIAVSDHFALGQTMMNRDFRAAADIARNRVEGVLAWESGEYALLKNIPKSYIVQPGDPVVTSQSSILFPPNIPLGTVVQVGDEPNTFFKRIAVKPAVDFQSLDEVFVVLATPNEEQKELEQSYRRKVEAAQKRKAR